MVMDLILTGLLLFLFYVVNRLCLEVLAIKRRLDNHGGL